MDLLLDTGGDLALTTVGRRLVGQPCTGTAQIGQRARLRLLVGRGEYRPDAAFGMDWRSAFAKPSTGASVQARVIESLSDVPGTIGRPEVQVGSDDRTRVAHVDFTLYTPQGETVRASVDVEV